MRRAVLLLLQPLLSAAARLYLQDVDGFPGWKGELPNNANNVALLHHLAPTSNNLTASAATYKQDGEELWHGEIEQVSWAPRLFLLKGFLSEEECIHLINIAKPHMTNSTIIDSVTGKTAPSKARTSTSSTLKRLQDDVVARIEHRISLVTHLPVENGEGMQILRYVDGQQYARHHDYFKDKVHLQDANSGGQRVATVLMYLSTVEEGGETVFPAANSKVSGPGWSECAKKGLAVKPRRGDATFFYSLGADGQPDPTTVHASCPTTKGEKWTSTKWIRVHARIYGPTKSPPKGAT